MPSEDFGMLHICEYNIQQGKAKTLQNINLDYVRSRRVMVGIKYSF